MTIQHIFEVSLSILLVGYFCIEGTASDILMFVGGLGMVGSGGLMLFQAGKVAGIL